MYYTISNEFINNAQYRSTAGEQLLLRYIIAMKQNEPALCYNAVQIVLKEYCELTNNRIQSTRNTLNKLKSKTYYMDGQEHFFFLSVEPVNDIETVYIATLRDHFLEHISPPIIY